MAIEHNDFVAQTTNRQTVLNILRAREREPMHFTSFSLVAGKVQGAGQLGLNTAFNGDGGSLAQTDTTATTTAPAGLTTAVTDSAVDTLTRGATNWTPSAQVSVTTGTDFQIAVNASEEFYRGILGPLSSGVIVHYLRQGFPRDLLSHLVLRRLEFRVQILGPDKKQIALIPLRTFENSPDEPAKAAEFAEVLKCWQLWYRVQVTPAVTVPAPEVRDLAGVNPDVLGRLRSKKDEKTDVISYYLEITPERTELKLALAEDAEATCKMREAFQVIVGKWTAEKGLEARQANPAATDDRRAAAADAALSAGGPRIVAETTGDEALARELAISGGVGGSGEETLSGEAEYLERLLPQGYKAMLQIEMTLRSVEGILYYLGEYARNEGTSPKLKLKPKPNPDPRVPPLTCRKREEHPYCLPIIRVLAASEVSSSRRLIDVVYRGRRYAVPMSGSDLNEESGRSSQTISLVQQLLNLHRSSKDLPFTPLLRVQN